MGWVAFVLLVSYGLSAYRKILTIHYLAESKHGI